MKGRAEEQAETGGAQRIDKWLWFARVTKTRTLAAGLVQAGKVRVNRTRVEKPSQLVRVDDVLTVLIGRRVALLRVVGLGLRRGPPEAARALYQELTGGPDALKPLAQPPLQILSSHATEVGPGRRPPGSGRPTKKERREIDRLGGKVR